MIRPIHDVVPLFPAALNGLHFPAGWSADTPRQKRMRVIQRVANAHDVDVADIMGRDRTRAVSRARWEAIATIRQRFGDSMPMIGRLFGLDHTSVLHALRRFEEMRHAG